MSTACVMTQVYVHPRPTCMMNDFHVALHHTCMMSHKYSRALPVAYNWCLKNAIINEMFTTTPRLSAPPPFFFFTFKELVLL